MLAGDKIQGFKGAEHLEGGAKVLLPLLQAFRHFPREKMRMRRPALQEWGGRKFHSLNGLSRRLREKGEALRVGVCPDIPALSW